MIAWALDTLIWTGAMIGLVLIVRRPFARKFGPRVAYALWLLPFARLLFPKITLPAAPGVAPVPVASIVSTVQVDAAGPGLAGVLLAVWLTGAVVTVAWRFGSYLRMRRRLLAEAQAVGQRGRVRIVETPWADGPLAFGIVDPVVALPIGFSVATDPVRRELAIEHELAHHHGGDLAFNLLVQPLFALHWFTPLGRLGWNAMRRDQEAACDARVLAHRGADSRAAYAALIASCAARPATAHGFSMAAGMACSALGAPSIVHRLRSLAVVEVSRSRRLSGFALLAGLGSVLPLTATISYAASTLGAPATPAAPLQTERSSETVLPREASAVPTIKPQPTSSSASSTAPATPVPASKPTLKTAPAASPVTLDESRLDELWAKADGYMVDGGKRIDEALARMPAIDRKSATRDIFQQTVNGVPVRTIDCKAFRAGEEDKGDPLAERVCSDQPGFVSAGGLSIARSIIARNNAISDTRRSELLAGIDSAIAESDSGR